MGRPHTEETKAKLRIAQLGRKHTDEAKAKMSRSQKGKMFSAETREKLCEARKNYRHTDETKAKISASNTGKEHSPEAIEKMRLAHRLRLLLSDRLKWFRAWVSRFPLHSRLVPFVPAQPHLIMGFSKQTVEAHHI